MRHDPVRQWDVSDLVLGELPFVSNAKTREDLYDVATALRIVRRMETSAGRGAVFNEIKAKNPLYRLVDTLYTAAGSRTMQPLLLFAYMLKSALSVGPLGSQDAETVSVSQFGNEHHSIERVAALVPDARILRLSLTRRHLIGRGQLRTAWQMLRSAKRVLPFLARLAQAHSFMPAARIASALAFYMRFAQFFADRPNLRSAIVASNYSPEAVGLAAAAHQAGRRVIYINHAPVPANSPMVPPVLADCAIFYGDAVRNTYERRSRCRAEVALIGQPWVARSMQWRDGLTTVGIFLTSGTKKDVVFDLVAGIRASHPAVRILIRNHPVALLKSDFSDLVARFDNLEVTIGNPLDDEIAACDLIFCGNSGVAMNAVSGGRPVAYLDALDRSGFDYNGFIASGLIYDAGGWSSDLYQKLKWFYSRADWREIMRTYDASYEADVAALEASAAKMILRHIRPQSN